MKEWRGIESAPKDGTRVLVYQPGGKGGVAIGFWERQVSEAWALVDDDTGKRVVEDTSYWNWEGDIVVYAPTHWAPLEPPS